MSEVKATKLDNKPTYTYKNTYNIYLQVEVLFDSGMVISSTHPFGALIFWTAD